MRVHELLDLLKDENPFAEIKIFALDEYGEELYLDLTQVDGYGYSGLIEFIAE